MGSKPISNQSPDSNQTLGGERQSGGWKDYTKTQHTMTDNQDPIWITQQQLAARWDVSTMFLWRLRKDKKITAYRIGKRAVRYRLSDVVAVESNLGVAGE